MFGLQALVAHAVVGALATAEPAAPAAWRYHVGDLPAAPRALPDWSEMPVPSNWYARGVDTHGVVWFAAEVDLPRRGHWAIRFEGIDYAADVYWDGQRVGGHRGYFAPFSVELGRAAGRHLLAVRVDSPRESKSAFSLRKTLIKGVLSHHDTRPGGAWSERGQEANTGGIWGQVQLQRRRAGRIDGIAVSTVARTASRAQLRIEVQAASIGAPARATFAIRDPGGQVVARGDLGEVGPAARKLVHTLSLPRPRLWWPAELGAPDLHTIEVRLAGPGGADRATEAFGIRTVAEVGGRLLVNDVPLFLRGTNYIGSLYLADFGSEAMERDLRLMQAAHINAVRVHAHVLPRRFYALADRLGLVVWQDFPLQWGYEESAAFTAEAVRQVGEMQDLLGNHPSIAFWCGHNEAPWSSDWMIWKYPDWDPDQNRSLDRAVEQALARDRGRPFRANSHPSEHAWMGWYSGSMRDFDKPTAQPFLTEFGAQAVPALDTLRTFLTPAQLWPLDEKNLPLWEHHNFQLRELRTIAKVPLGDSVEALVANTQAYQARLLQTAAEGLRRQKWQPVGGIFQFMFVEHWASMSWGVVDHLRQPKPGYQALARAYQPLLVSARRKPKQDRLAIYVINDGRTAPPEVFLQAGDDPEAPLVPIQVAANDVVLRAESLPVPAADQELRLRLVDGQRRVLSENLYPRGYFTP